MLFEPQGKLELLTKDTTEDTTYFGLMPNFNT